ncbi:hypothetical protein HGO38_26075 [Rhizobium sp. CG5]|uniref:hypothetical protein n=1 Tax=Rhizobium sp. CG5 TaxID=2726076 RepID=UPI002033F03E|nr:hypothetical protein [Rhizobium sp. CG5]MCM2476921.1 hypothetical protein [Rhizobium sp. CG5]
MTGIAEAGGIAKLQALWTEGKASGEPTEVDFDQVLKDARQELESARTLARQIGLDTDNAD